MSRLHRREKKIFITAMQQKIIKYFSPILYALFSVPIAPGVYFALILSDIAYHLVGFNFLSQMSIKLTEVAYLVLATLLLLFANRILTKLENLSHPTIGDHFRQSIVFYSLILATVVKVIIFNGHSYPRLDAWFSVVTVGISLLAITVNGIYLYQRQKAA